ncbi:MAG: hydrolase 1, exosortase A system-associated [Sphingorhabdus sp.]
MRRMIFFDGGGDRLAATLDVADGTTGLLIVSGGNEIRSGAHTGQAAIAQHLAKLGVLVFRYDRRGIGESEGENRGFESSADDIASAVSAFRAEAPQMRHLVAFGNCDAASALAFFHDGLAIDALVLANPWVIEAADDDKPTAPTAAAIRARYLARLKNPRSLIDLFTGKIDLKKLAGGLAKAAQKEAPTGLAARLADALAATQIPVHILIADRDTTAMAFMGVYKGTLFDPVRAKANVRLSTTNSPSHSFADAVSKDWLLQKLSDHFPAE